MVRWLLDNTAKYRFENIEDVRAFEEKCRTDAEQNGYNVSKFNYVKKDIKVEGEIVDDYYIVSLSTVFNDAKDPETNVIGVEYDFRDPYQVEEE